jgi:RsiG-like
LKDWLQLAILQEPFPLSIPGAASMEALPDLDSLSDQGLRDLIRDLMDEEREVSYRRRILHGKIDILRAELQARLKKDVGEGKSPLHDIDVDRLAEILASKAAPPAD